MLSTSCIAYIIYLVTMKVRYYNKHFIVDKMKVKEFTQITSLIIAQSII